MPMDPVTTNAQTVNGPVTHAPAIPATPSSVAGLPAPAVGASGLPAVAAPAAQPAAHTPAPVQAPVPAESPELIEVRAALARATAENARLAPYAQLGYRSALNQPPQPGAPAPAAPAAKANILGVPELDPNVQAWIGTNAEGDVVALPGAPPGVIEQYRTYQRSLATAVKALASDPEKVLAPVLEKMQQAAVEKAKKDFEATQSEARNKAVAAQIVQANEGWMYEKDAAGNRVVVADQLTGQQSYKRTQGGELWTHAVGELMQAGLNDPVVIDQYAKAYTHLQTWRLAEQARLAGQPAAPVPAPAGVQPVATAPPTAQPAQPVVDLKTAFLNRVPGALPGSHTPAGSSPVPAGRRLTLREAMLQGLTQEGYQVGSRLPMPHQQAAA